MTRRLILSLVLLSGCDLYWNQQGDDVCKDVAYPGGGAALEFRDPNNGQCQYFGGGGGGCFDGCGPCYETPPSQANPDWGTCGSSCEALSESDCIATSGCYAAYDENGAILDAPAGTTFKGCWQTAPSGPISSGTCFGLDAHACSQHDNCAAFYDSGADALVAGPFLRCAPEPSAASCATVDCGPGTHCEDQCKPCPPNADCSTETVCNAVCVPDASTCANVDCGLGFECVESCAQPTTDTSGGGAPLQCYPQCVPTTACEVLPDEAACTGRSDCTPVYDGQNCTCYPGYCSCEILTYERCESLATPPPQPGV